MFLRNTFCFSRIPVEIYHDEDADVNIVRGKIVAFIEYENQERIQEILCSGRFLVIEKDYQDSFFLDLFDKCCSQADGTLFNCDKYCSVLFRDIYLCATM